MNKNISDKDKKDWEIFINSSDKLPNKDHNKENKTNIKIRSIDLHGHTLTNANKVVEEFINKSFSENINKLVVITGKGIHSDNKNNPYVSKDLSILKNSVPEFILNNQDLMKKINEIASAKIEDGGSGSFYIFLKKNRKNE